jgi:hypothetical protein
VPEIDDGKALPWTLILESEPVSDPAPNEDIDCVPKRSNPMQKKLESRITEGQKDEPDPHLEERHAGWPFS